VSGVSTLSTWNSFFLNFFNFQNNIKFSLPLASYFTMIIDYFMFLLSFKLFYYPFFSLNVILKTIFCNFSFFFNFNTYYFNLKYTNLTTLNTNYFITQDNFDFNNFFKNNFLEKSNKTRYTRFNNLLVNYDYKTGHYIGSWEQQYPYLYSSFIEVARGIRKPSWFLSEKYTELLNNNYNKFCINFTGKANLKMSNVEDWYHSHIVPVDNFYNLYNSVRSSIKTSDLVSTRWISFLSMDQKFYKMFTSSSTQQRILANWRQLKFTREAWRCKLLVARHQNTLYRRFTSEESLVYSIERNAKDLLPGWAMITPFSSRTRFTTIGRIDVGLMGVFFAINASIVSSANFLVTYRYLSTLNNRKMRDARSFFSESLIVSSWMMVAANPMLAISILMLLSDRHWQTSFFDYSGGGDTVLFQHMFWFFGHPEVYIILIPIFGFTNTIMSFYFRKRV
jgi:hypothetical protein